MSSERQKEDQTIASQTAALKEHAAASGLEVPAEWIFEDEGYSGATLVRPGLERLRDLAAQVEVEVVMCYSPDRLARKYAYQALLMEEFARVGTEGNEPPAGGLPGGTPLAGGASPADARSAQEGVGYAIPARCSGVPPSQ